MFWCFLVGAWFAASTAAVSLQKTQLIQYSIYRRAGSFPSPDVADLPYLLQQLQITESRFSTTSIHSQGDGNTSRRPKHQHGTQWETKLLGTFGVGRDGTWFTTLNMGEPVQGFDLDLDMLTGDFLVWSTSSNTGSWYLDYKSASYFQNSQAQPPFPGCRQSTDTFHTPALNYSMSVSFAHCRPRKCWIDTLLPSGACLGLAPSLRQTKSPHLFSQLLENNIIDEPVWKIKMSNANTGIFTIGPPVYEHQSHNVDHRDIEPIKFEAKDKLVGKGIRRSFKGVTHTHDWKSDWTWSKLHGPKGWWQLHMQGLWLNDSCILQDEEIILDINTPFIIAPPYAAHIFYSSIPNARHLPPPYDQFFAYPCLNPPKIQLEFMAEKFQILRNVKDEGSFAPGGRLSLGRLVKASEFCVGAIVEGRYGAGKSAEDVGMRNTWVMGQDLFRNMEIMFDLKGKVGMKKI